MSDQSLNAALHDAEDTARLWHWSWVGIFGTTVGVRAGLALGLDDPQQRDLQWISALPTAAGLISQLLQPLPGVFGGVSPAESYRERYHRLERYAHAEQARRSWLQHVLGIGVNAAAASYLLFVEDEPVAAALQLGIGAAISEMRILSSPRAASDALRGRHASASPTWGAAVGPRQVVVTLRF
ncbi:MAG: hypothetical protein AAFU79_13820 [Myxococcota bacterium]